MTYEIATEHATIVDDTRWQAGPRLQAMLDDGWEPFAVQDMSSENNRSIRSINCPLIWLRRDTDAKLATSVLEEISSKLDNLYLELERQTEQSRVQHDYPRQVEVIKERSPFR